MAEAIRTTIVWYLPITPLMTTAMSSIIRTIIAFAPATTRVAHLPVVGAVLLRQLVPHQYLQVNRKHLASTPTDPLIFLGMKIRLVNTASASIEEQIWVHGALTLRCYSQIPVHFLTQTLIQVFNMTTEYDRATTQPVLTLLPTQPLQVQRAMSMLAVKL